jgi:ankyrin repeat protein
MPTTIRHTDWSPLMYVAYSRLHVSLDHTITTARRLLDAGADPNDGRFFLGLPTPFTLVTGVFGGGEQDQPAHPHSVALARALLEAGAEPNDGQTLYNRMFRTDDDFLEVLFEFGLGQGDGGPWRRALPDLLPPPRELLANLLDWAVTHDQRDRVELLARNGVDVVSARADGSTPITAAIRNGHRELAAVLERLGATAPALDAVDAFVAAALAGDADAVRATPPAVVEAARRRRPALVVWAAGQERIDAVELLVASGFAIDALGRSDIPIEQQWQTALHTAVERGNAVLARRLLDLGADRDVVDTRFGATPLGWAEHFGSSELVEVLRP